MFENHVTHLEQYQAKVSCSVEHYTVQELKQKQPFQSKMDLMENNKRKCHTIKVIDNYRINCNYK